MLARVITDSPDTKRRFGVSLMGRTAAVAAVGLVGLGLAACSSSSSSGTTTTTTNPAVSAASLEQWPTSSVSVTEDGSSLLAPVFEKWASAISQQWPKVAVSGAAGGSAKGINDAASGTVNIGGSDAYLSSTQQSANPGLVNIPTAISAQQVNYNVPGVPASTHIKLSGTILSQIYQGTITKWNAPAITAINQGVSLPDLTIVPVHRSDGSGDTFLFTSYLAASDPSGWGTKYPANTSEQWPNVGSAGNGNSGMVSACQATKGCVAYIGVSYLTQTNSAGLGYAALQNKAGNYEVPTSTSIVAEASGFATTTPASGTISMIFGPASGGYPIVNYEYAIVNTTQSSSSVAQAVKAVLAWCVDPSGGNSSTYLSTVNFQPLPSAVEQISLTLIGKIGS